ncbi:MAG TPA: M4 family metallopeptidase [Kofleriaceae bacterium]|nr:M4 family metallopeptidase [Kofleriaceae bacterium]
MLRLARLATVSITLLAIPSCLPSDDASPTQSVQVFHRGDPASEQLAEQLTWKHLARVEPALADSLAVRRVHIDDQGRAFTRLTQTISGIPVFGAEAVVELSPTGELVGTVDKLARDLRVDTVPALSAAEAVSRALGTRGLAARQVASKTDLQILVGHGKERLAHRVQLAYDAAGQPQRRVIFIDAQTGAELWSYDNLQTARNRELHNLNHGTSLPGPIARVEGGAATGDNDVDTNYAMLGWTYDCYNALYGRDSFDNAGAKLISSVHYSSNYVNAFWDGTQMVYGDGDNVYSISLAISMDVTAHELTHAVTEYESNLIYSGESGGLNESMSDIFGGVCEWYRDNAGNTNGPTSANTYLVGDEIWLPEPALRYMADPVTDGTSLDFWTSSAGNVDVHYSSGISNLAFYLLAEGGTHPRGKSSTVVTGIGIRDAAAIFYRANANYLTPGSTFADARAQTAKAAADLFGASSAQVAQTNNAWTAVGVLPPPDYQVIDTKTNLSSSTQLSYSYPANGATAMKFVISGGTGDADLYVKFNTPASETVWDCRPYSGTNNESCEFNPAQSGTYYVMIRAYSAYTGVTLTVSAAGGGGGPTTETSCTDGVDNDSDGATDCSDSDCSGNSACGPSPWTVISSADFESGMDPYTLGGTNASRVSGGFANSGTYSVRIRASGTAASFATTTGMNLAGKTGLRVQYSMIANGMENGKDYFVELQVNGGTWQTIGNFVAGTGFTNGVRQAKDLQVSLPGTSNVKVRFRCDGSQKNDEVYIDDVVVSAK